MGGTAAKHAALPSLRDWHQSDKSQGAGGLVPQDTFGSSFLHHYPNARFFHFTLNQNISTFYDSATANGNVIAKPVALLIKGFTAGNNGAAYDLLPTTAAPPWVSVGRETGGPPPGN
jgi:hypothetical protein